MSDWASRPLTTRQLQYAALDALVLPHLYDVLCKELGPQQQQGLLQQHVQMFVRVRAETATDVASQQAELNEQVRESAGLRGKRQSIKLSPSHTEVKQQRVA